MKTQYVVQKCYGKKGPFFVLLQVLIFKNFWMDFDDLKKLNSYVNLYFMNISFVIKKSYFNFSMSIASE